MSSHGITHLGESLDFLPDKILKAIYDAINQQNPFKAVDTRLELDCANIAKNVYSNMPSSISSLEDLVKGNSGQFNTFGAYPLKDDKLNDWVKKIYTKILEHLDNMPPPFLAHILKSSAEMGEGSHDIFSINSQVFPFMKKTGQLQPVSTGDKKSGDKLLRAHLCKVSMTAGSKVLDNIQEGIYNRYQYLVDNADNIPKEEVLADIKSQLHKLFDNNDNLVIRGLCDLLDTESAGLIKREAGISYLEYLLKNAKRQEIECRALEKIVNNIRFVEKYIYAPERNNHDCKYQVTEQHACDLREILGNANAFDSELPVIGEIDGNLEERTSEDERVFVFGIRFKANNPVSNPDKDFPEIGSNNSVYAYHLKKAIKVLELAKQFNTPTGGENTNYRKLTQTLIEKAIRTVFLYYMVFSKSKHEDDKKQVWQAIAIKLSDARNNDALDKLIALADNMLKGEKVVVETTIKPAISALKQVLRKLATCTQNELDTQRFLLLDKHLVNDDLEEAKDGNVLKDLKNAIQRKALRQCLRYVRIVKTLEGIPADYLYSTVSPIYLSFYDTFFYANKRDRRNIEVSTPIPQDELKFLPVLVEPKFQPTDKVETQYYTLLQKAGLKVTIKQCLSGNKATNHLSIFFCKITMAIIFQLALSALCEKLKNEGNHFVIPIVRVHGGEDDNNNEAYFKSVCASVTFLLNEKYTANLQGIRLINLDSVKDENKKQGLRKYAQLRVTNARSSLYAFLPKTFSVPNFAPAFHKLAIVVVSSRVAGKHRHQDDDSRIVNLFGRVIMLECVNENIVQVNTHFLTFANNYYQKDIKDGNVGILIDTIHQLYDKHDVQDILYIAKFPFTTHLNMTRKESQRGLFFMSETILQAMRQNHHNLNIYPTFCDKYPARMLTASQLHTIYIDDVPSIQKQVQRDSAGHSQIVTFLNIANGISVKPVKRKGQQKDEDIDKNFFNNIMSYITLDNIYTDRTLQSRIMERMIASDTAPRKTLIDFLCLLHAAAYQKFEKKELSQFTLKLNPYQDILETDNVNKLSTFTVEFPHRKVDFNLFAFMTKMQRIVSLISEKSG